MSRREIRQLQELEPWFSDSSEELPKRLVYVYYCEVCDSILALRSKLEYLQSFLYSAVDRCPNCHFSLETTLRCRVLNIRIPTSLLTRESTQTLSPRNSFATLESLLNSNVANTPTLGHISRLEDRSLSFGIKDLDEMFGGVRKNQFTFLYGGKVCQAIAERLCVRSQLPVGDGGFGAASVFIDGGNTFDVYHASEYATMLYLDRDKVLRDIKVSRAFTCYQLVNLIVDKLPMLLCEQSIGLVVISNILDLFLDSEVDLKEAKHTVNFLSSFLAQLAREKQIALVATCPTQRNGSDVLLRQFLTGRAQVVLKAEQRVREVRFTLKKHPSKQPATQTTYLVADAL
ncbi:hypothetical protein A3K71_02490 [archaeon RBG_16_50_20]|nr:MAG: hypothetical protein A3K71_02490 [archaeon RBG_16_50_20]